MEVNHEEKRRSFPDDENEPVNNKRQYKLTYYDERGRNISEQLQRQNKVPWTTVKYSRGRLFIPEDKRIILRSMNLI